MHYLTYIFGAIILGGLIYLVLTTMKYMKFLEVAQPSVKRLRERAKELNQTLEAEKKLSHSVIASLQDLRKEITNTKLDVVEAEKDLLEARQREEQLELANQKKAYKRGSR